MTLASLQNLIDNGWKLRLLVDKLLELLREGKFVEAQRLAESLEVSLYTMAAVLKIVNEDEGKEPVVER
jgi:hypothetical protein